MSTLPPARNAATLSVIVPNWNCAPWLPEALDSLLNQSSPPEQVIVIDDGSTDNSIALLEALAAQHPQLTLLRGERGGVSAARTKGLAIATGDFIYFMDADDFVERDLFADFRRTLADHPEMEMFCFGARMFTDKPVAARDYQRFHQRHVDGVWPGGADTLRAMIPHRSAHRVLWSSILSRRLIERTGVQFLPIQNHEDAPYMFALYMAAKQIGFTQKSYYNKRFMPTSLSQGKASFAWVENYYIARRSSEAFLREQGLPPEEKLLDHYYQPVMYGCLIEIRKNNIAVPASWHPTIDQLVRKVTGESKRLKLLWYYPTLYSGLQACRRLARYASKR